MESFKLACVEETLWLVTQPTGVGVYDFQFDRYFECRHPLRLERPVLAVARMGAAQDYLARYRAFAEIGIQLIHTHEEYERTSEFPNWYPLLADVTPRSVWFEGPVSAREVEQHFTWPVFVKGHRQTNRHRRDQAIITSAEKFDALMLQWRAEPILGWQKVICREFLPLEPVGVSNGVTLPKSYEFRTFCWKGQCVGMGAYWYSETYKPTDAEATEITRLAELAATRLSVPFLVVDIARTVAGRWIVVEVNDGQDSGYAAIKPMMLWRRILDLEKGRT